MKTERSTFHSLCLAVFLIGCSALAASYSPIVVVRTSPAAAPVEAGDNLLVQGTKVDFWDEDLAIDDYLGNAHTSFAGTAQVIFNDSVEAPDVYIVVKC
jgi:hypothetical protein